MSKFSAINPLIPLDSEFRIRKALECSPNAALIIAGAHGLGLVLSIAKGVMPVTIAFHAVAILAACGLGVLVRRSPRRWEALLILAWAIVETPFTSPAFFVVRALSVLLAFQGLRGVLAKQKVQSTIAAFD